MKKFALIILQILIIFAVSLAALFLFGAVPEEMKGFWKTFSSEAATPLNNSTDSLGSADISASPIVSPDEIYFSDGPKPERLIIKKIGVDSEVLSPETRDVTVLDAVLKEGIVNYPSGASLDTGNVLLFGHSTNWTTVQNPAYKSLNNLDKLALGDEISVRSGGREYIYRVSSVNLVDAEKALVNLESSRRIITVSTCDTFGEKANRIVVEAVYSRDYEVLSAKSPGLPL